jgi:ribonuclease R
VIEILGNYADPGMEIEIALRKHDLPYEFSRQALEAAKRLPTTVDAKDLKGRKDLRKLAFVTIDGETARDFDDAVYCERVGKNFKLWVAIADVSHYVKPGEPLDAEAYERGNSVYFPRRVIPMLPEELSNELCSLKPDVDRLVMVCEMEVTAGGVVKHYEFYPGVFHSHARLTYTRVAAVIEGGEADPPVAAALVPKLGDLDAVFRALLASRQKRGAIDFDSVETRMIFDDHGKIEKIVRVERNDAHRLIEECMLAANVCAPTSWRRTSSPRFSRARGPHGGEARGVARDAQGLRPHARRRDKPHAKDYAELPADQGQALRGNAVDGDAALARRRCTRPKTSATSASLAYAHSLRPSAASRSAAHCGIKAVLEGALRRRNSERDRPALLRDRAARRRRDATWSVA